MKKENMENTHIYIYIYEKQLDSTINEMVALITASHT